MAAFDQFHDLRRMSDPDAARLIAERDIHIAIDLKGYTTDNRFGLLASRPAPVQVTYLGSPGTTGADFIDYAIVDRFVAPPEQQVHFTECLVHLPNSYMVNDSRRRIADAIPTRAQCGLPEDGFVFCCFNNTYKITPTMFDIWMRLLAETSGSVLWLLGDNAPAERNLRREADARGVDPTRLVFASRLPLADHLARHRNGDLFLDTLPYNAHTTASDALWVGLPVVTCPGKSFAARVAGSLLHAVGLPELVTESLADYEALALKLAREPETLRAITAKLARNKATAPLFDCAGFCRDLEAAYEEMWGICARGEPPRPIVVE